METIFVDHKEKGKGNGSRARPFGKIQEAAEAAKPGDKILIAPGIYREQVRPRLGGSGPGRRIRYEALPGGPVVLKGSLEAGSGWKKSDGWRGKAKGVYQRDLRDLDFQGYNPFGLVNVLHDRFWLDLKKISSVPYFRRRGELFWNGIRMNQVELYRDLAERDGTFWIEHNGLRIHARFPGEAPPSAGDIEVSAREQVFAPADRFLGWISLKGLHFQHAGNGFPVPQRGLVSTNRGHHWTFEDCVFEDANAVLLDIGKEDWHAPDPDYCGGHVIRRCTFRRAGICGLAGLSALDCLVEDCLFEDIGYQGAELMYESAGIKVHNARKFLFRRNLVRRMNGGSGIWLDCGNVGCRVENNSFLDIACINGAVHFEGTHDANVVAGNLINGVTCQPGPEGQKDWGGLGVYAQGTDRLTVENNLIMNCEISGFRGDTIAQRIIGGRGGTGRKNRVLRNVIHNCGRSAVTFANEHSTAEGNHYSKMPGGYLRVDTPEPPRWLDLEAWREFYGWDKRGIRKDLNLMAKEGSFRIGSMTWAMDPRRVS